MEQRPHFPLHRTAPPKKSIASILVAGTTGYSCGSPVHPLTGQSGLGHKSKTKTTSGSFASLLCFHVSHSHLTFLPPETYNWLAYNRPARDQRGKLKMTSVGACLDELFLTLFVVTKGNKQYMGMKPRTHCVTGLRQIGCF